MAGARNFGPLPNLRDRAVDEDRTVDEKMKRILIALALIVGLAFPTTAAAETARPARDFHSSVGINTHLGYSDTVYWQHWPMIRDRIR